MNMDKMILDDNEERQAVAKLAIISILQRCAIKVVRYDRGVEISRCDDPFADDHRFTGSVDLHITMQEPMDADLLRAMDDDTLMDEISRRLGKKPC